MEKVKLSALSKDTIVFVDGDSTVLTVEKILEDIESYKTEKVYTTKVYHANLDAKSMLDDAKDGTKRYTTDVAVESAEFIGYKESNGADFDNSSAQGNNNDYENLGSGNDITPVDDGDMPF